MVPPPQGRKGPNKTRCWCPFRTLEEKRGEFAQRTEIEEFEFNQAAGRGGYAKECTTESEMCHWGQKQIE